MLPAGGQSGDQSVCEMHESAKTEEAEHEDSKRGPGEARLGRPLPPSLPPSPSSWRRESRGRCREEAGLSAVREPFRTQRDRPLGPDPLRPPTPHPALGDGFSALSTTAGLLVSVSLTSDLFFNVYF